MKAISIKEPWAGMILRGEKSIETRTWTTNYRGFILLCASKNPRSIISGKAFAIAELFDIQKMIPFHEQYTKCEVYPKAQSWFLKNIIPIVPFDIKGQLGIFDVIIPSARRKE